MSFWPAHEEPRGGKVPSDEFTVAQSLHIFLERHKKDSTQPSEWDMISMLCGYVTELEEKLVHMQRRLIDLHGEY